MKKLFFLTALCSFTFFQSQSQVPTKKINERIIAEKQNEPTITAQQMQN
jgi:hypothetical protein